MELGLVIVAPLSIMGWLATTSILMLVTRMRVILSEMVLVLLVDLWFEVLTWMCIISPVNILTHPCLAVRKFTIIIVTILIERCHLIGIAFVCIVSKWR